MWHSDTAGRDHNSKRARMHWMSFRIFIRKTWNRFHLQLPFSKNESWWTRVQRGSNGRGVAGCVCVGGGGGAGGDKTVEVTSDAKETEMSFRLSARTSPPSLPLCESQRRRRRRQFSECHTCPPIEPTTDERQRPQRQRQPSGLYLSGREKSESRGKWDECRQGTYAANLIGSGVAARLERG